MFSAAFVMMVVCLLFLFWRAMDDGTMDFMKGIDYAALAVFTLSMMVAAATI